MITTDINPFYEVSVSYAESVEGGRGIPAVPLLDLRWGANWDVGPSMKRCNGAEVLVRAAR